MIDGMIARKKRTAYVKLLLSDENDDDDHDDDHDRQPSRI